MSHRMMASITCGSSRHSSLCISLSLSRAEEQLTRTEDSVAHDQLFPNLPPAFFWHPRRFILYNPQQSKRYSKSSFLGDMLVFAHNITKLRCYREFPPPHHNLTVFPCIAHNAPNALFDCFYVWYKYRSLRKQSILGLYQLSLTVVTGSSSILVSLGSLQFVVRTGPRRVWTNECFTARKIDE